jgi:serine O-acetyltransferase
MLLKQDDVRYISNQIANMFPDKIDHYEQLGLLLDEVNRRLTFCFSKIKSKYYSSSDGVLFNRFNSDHYCKFIYFFSNEAFKNGFIVLAEKLFCLNKALHGIDLFYSIELPSYFLFVHPVGSVIGNASYSNGLVVYQNVTVGSDLDGIYPTIGENCVLYSGASLIGNCSIGNNSILAAKSYLRNGKSNSSEIIVGSYPESRFLKNSKINYDSYFR